MFLNRSEGNLRFILYKTCNRNFRFKNIATRWCFTIEKKEEYHKKIMEYFVYLHTCVLFDILLVNNILGATIALSMAECNLSVGIRETWRAMLAFKSAKLVTHL